MPDLHSKTLRIAASLPKGDPTRRKLLAALTEQFVLRIRIPKGPDGDALIKQAIRIIGRRYLEGVVPYDRGTNQISFAIPDERKAIKLWRSAERGLGIKVDMEIEDL